MKKLILFLIILIIPFTVKAIVGPTSDFYINDYANILSPETEKYILEQSLRLNDADGTQFVVLTVPNLGGMRIEDYANIYFNQNGIGDKEKGNGLLMLIAVKERQSRIEVGDGLEGILPDGKTGRFQDEYMIPYLRQNYWDSGVRNGYDAFYKEIVTKNHLNIDYNKPVILETSERSKVDITTFIGGFLLGLAITEYFDSRKKNNLMLTYLLFGTVLCMLFNFNIDGIFYIILLGLEISAFASSYLYISRKNSLFDKNKKKVEIPDNIVLPELNDKDDE